MHDDSPGADVALDASPAVADAVGDSMFDPSEPLPGLPRPDGSLGQVHLREEGKKIRFLNARIRDRTSPCTSLRRATDWIIADGLAVMDGLNVEQKGREGHHCLQLRECGS